MCPILKVYPLVSSIQLMRTTWIGEFNLIISTLDNKTTLTSLLLQVMPTAGFFICQLLIIGFILSIYLHKQICTCQYTFCVHMVTQKSVTNIVRQVVFSQQTYFPKFNLKICSRTQCCCRNRILKLSFYMLIITLVFTSRIRGFLIFKILHWCSALLSFK